MNGKSMNCEDDKDKPLPKLSISKDDFLKIVGLVTIGHHFREKVEEAIETGMPLIPLDEDWSMEIMNDLIWGADGPADIETRLKGYIKIRKLGDLEIVED